MSKTINDVIEEYCKKKLPPSEIFRLMKEVVSRRGVYKAVKRFKDTGTCAPRIRSDPERTVRTKKLIKKVREKLRRNPARSARQLAKDYSVSVSSMQRILKDDLQSYPYKFTKRHLLSEATKKKRLDRAKVLVKKLVDGTQPQVLWTDEKLFTVQAVHNHQNDRIWLPDINMVPVEHRSSFRRQKPASVMVWAGTTSKGLKTPLIFIEEGVKINQTVYRRMLEEKVLPRSSQRTRSYSSTGRCNLPHGQLSSSLVLMQFQRFLGERALAAVFTRLEPYGFWVMVYFRDKSLSYFSSKSGLSKAKIDIGMGRN